MSLPELSRAQYDEVTSTYRSRYDEEPEIYWLQAPDPDQLFKDNWNETNRQGLRVQTLGIREVSMYVNEQGHRLIIFPLDAEITYDLLFTVWPSKTRPFALTLRENLYDNLEDITMYFRWGFDSEDGNDKLPEFKLDDGRTH